MRKRFGSASVTAVSSVFVSAFYGAARHALDIVFLHEHKEQHDGYGDDADDRNPYLEDDTYNPLQQILTSIANEERSVRMEKLKVALSELTDKQKDTVIKKFYRGMTNVQIAAEEGVSEAAIRNRLTKIYATLKKKI